MHTNKEVTDLTIDDLHIAHELINYDVAIDLDATVGSIIYEHLNSKPGFIKHKRSLDKNKELKEIYSKALHKTVSKGAPMEIFISTFSPKVTNPSITNGYIYPDMADLLTLIHLHYVAKGIREVYDYGFRFIIGYRGHVYQDFFNWSKEDVQKCYKNLHRLRDVAEKIVGVRNVIRFVETDELIEQEGAYFKDRWEKETQHVQKKYEEKDPFYIRKIDAWVNDFKYALNPTNFQTKEELHTHLFTHAIHYRALKNIEYTGGEHNLGICNSFPNILLATIRGLDEKMSIQLNPFFRFHSHQRLISLSKEGMWKTLKWSDMEESDSTYEPVYFEDFDYPFYFKET